MNSKSVEPGHHEVAPAKIANYSRVNGNLFGQKPAGFIQIGVPLLACPAVSVQKTLFGKQTVAPYYRTHLTDQFVNDVTMYVRQSVTTPLVLVIKLLVINPEQPQDRRM